MAAVITTGDDPNSDNQLIQPTLEEQVKHGYAILSKTTDLKVAMSSKCTAYRCNGTTCDGLSHLMRDVVMERKDACNPIFSSPSRKPKRKKQKTDGISTTAQVLSTPDLSAKGYTPSNPIRKTSTTRVTTPPVEPPPRRKANGKDVVLFGENLHPPEEVHPVLESCLRMRQEMQSAGVDKVRIASIFFSHFEYTCTGANAGARRFICTTVPVNLPAEGPFCKHCIVTMVNSCIGLRDEYFEAVVRKVVDNMDCGLESPMLVSSIWTALTVPLYCGSSVGTTDRTAKARLGEVFRHWNKNIIHRGLRRLALNSIGTHTMKRINFFLRNHDVIIASDSLCKDRPLIEAKQADWYALPVEKGWTSSDPTMIGHFHSAYAGEISDSPLNRAMPNFGGDNNDTVRVEMTEESPGSGLLFLLNAVQNKMEYNITPFFMLDNLSISGHKSWKGPNLVAGLTRRSGGMIEYRCQSDLSAEFPYGSMFGRTEKEMEREWPGLMEVWKCISRRCEEVLASEFDPQMEWNARSVVSFVVDYPVFSDAKVMEIPHTFFDPRAMEMMQKNEHCIMNIYVPLSTSGLWLNGLIECPVAKEKRKWFDQNHHVVIDGEIIRKESAFLFFLGKNWNNTARKDAKKVEDQDFHKLEADRYNRLIEGTFLFVPYGDFVILPATMPVSGGHPTSVHGNPYMLVTMCYENCDAVDVRDGRSLDQCFAKDISESSFAVKKCNPFDLETEEDEMTYTIIPKTCFVPLRVDSPDDCSENICYQIAHPLSDVTSKHLMWAPLIRFNKARGKVRAKKSVKIEKSQPPYQHTAASRTFMTESQLNFADIFMI